MDLIEKQNTYKIVIVGRSSVGKSCLLLRFTDDRFVEDYISTIGVDFKFRSFKAEDKDFKLQIWDTAGQEKYQTITKTFYKGADAVIIVYDCSSTTSFGEAQTVWLEEARRHSEISTVISIIGNKVDQEDEKEISKEKLLDFCSEEKIMGFEASAKAGVGVEEAFIQTALEIYKRKKSQKDSQETGLNLNQKNTSNRENGCCN